MTGSATTTAASIVQGLASVAPGATLNISGPGAAAPSLTIANSGTVNVTGGNSQTVAAVGTSAAGNVGSLDVTGAGTQFSAGQVFQNSIEIDAGAELALTAASSAAMSTADALTIAANGNLDVGASGIVLSNMTTASIASLQNDIIASYNRGKYSGALGITSTAAATYDTSKQQTAIGMYYKNGTITIAAAVPGDLTLGGSVNNTDRSTFLRDYLKAVPANESDWQFGAFTYDSSVSNADRSLFLANYLHSSFPSDMAAGVSSAPSDMAVPSGGVAPVPEPGTLALLAAALAVAGTAVLRRRANGAA